MGKLIIRTLLFVIWAALTTSCMFYSMAGSIPAHINSIAIPIVENQTAEFGMSESVTENLLVKFNEENILDQTGYAGKDKKFEVTPDHIFKNLNQDTDFILNQS